MVNDFTELDFFRGSELIADPYPYYESLRQQCPVARENHHGVTMVTGWDEACAVLNDAETWSSCISVTGPFPGFPIPLEGDDITDLIESIATSCHSATSCPRLTRRLTPTTAPC